MLIQTKLSNKFWKKAVLTANYLYNKTFHSVLDFKSFYEKRYENTSNLNNIYVWKSSVWKKISKDKKLNNCHDRVYL